jgi:hypothetical protein
MTLQEGSQEDCGSKFATHHFKSKDPMTQSGAMVERIFPIRVQVLNKRHALPGGTSLSRPGLANCDVEGTQHSSQSSDDTIEDVYTLTLQNSPDILQSRSKFGASARLASAVEPSSGRLPPNNLFQAGSAIFPRATEVLSQCLLMAKRSFGVRTSQLRHISGAIQRYGALIAIREESGLFVVRAVSENLQSVTGLEANALFELRCFTDL